MAQKSMQENRKYGVSFYHIDGATCWKVCEIEKKTFDNWAEPLGYAVAFTMNSEMAFANVCDSLTGEVICEVCNGRIIYRMEV